MRVKVTVRTLWTPDYDLDTLRKFSELSQLPLMDRSPTASSYVKIPPVFYEDDEEFAKYMETGEKLGIEIPILGRDPVYTEPELLAADLLIMLPPVNHEDFTEADVPGTLQLFGDDLRKAKSLQLKVKQSLVKKMGWSLTDDWNYNLVCSTKVRAALEEAGIRGIRYWETVPFRKATTEPLPLFGMSFEDAVTIKAHDFRITVENPVCTLERAEADKIRDIGTTNAMLGRHWPVFARPNVYKALKAARARNISWYVAKIDE